MTTIFEVTLKATVPSGSTISGYSSHDGHVIPGQPVSSDSGGINESLEQQLIALYEERSQLNDALGVTTADEIIAKFARGGDSGGGMIDSLIDQLQSLYSERDQLRAALGVSTADEVIGLVNQLRH